mmetsp:Transcript_26866/g.54250  ORF Transcript_26866/g.54250 Transcript_26866/m.54250 type:complete len:110 (-) Transcript_26866:393-722(-)
MQVLLNSKRKSTSGWQIWNIILDFTGGALSILQLIGDSIAQARAEELGNGWTGIVGNPAKLGLGLVSIFFDVSAKCLWNSTSCLSLDYTIFFFECRFRTYYTLCGRIIN